MTTGASAGVSLILNVLITANVTGILIPIPQYPLYTATLAQYSGIPLPYHLSEPDGWSTSLHEIEAALAKAEKDGVVPRALVVINPGNPTGAILDKTTMQQLVRLCEKHSLVLLADEVYQANLHRPDTHPFHSFKQIVRDLNSPIPLFSFHSISKGVKGECGRRGGYFECSDEVQRAVGASAGAACRLDARAEYILIGRECTAKSDVVCEGGGRILDGRGGVGQAGVGTRFHAEDAGA